MAMQLVESNPFRLIGVLANTTEKELLSQKRKLSKYASVGKQLKSKHDFSLLDDCERTETNLNEAIALIEHRQERLDHALFWFVKENQFDEIALTHLSDGNVEKAIETWNKVTNGRPINDRNYSCYNNLSSLQLILGGKDNISQSIESKTKLITSNYFEAFVSLVTDDIFTIETKQQLKKTIYKLISELSSKYSRLQIIELFAYCTSDIIDIVINSFIEDPKFSIERLVNLTKAQKENDESRAYEFAKELYNKSINDLSIIEELVGKENIHYKSLSDAVASEILDCDIAFFNYWHESKDITDQSLELTKYAVQLAESDRVKQRANDEYQVSLHHKEQFRVSEYYTKIYEELENFRGEVTSIDTAIKIFNTCKPLLNKILTIMSTKDDEFITTCDLIVNIVLYHVIDEVNRVQTNDSSIDTVAASINRAIWILELISTFEMTEKTKNRFNVNISTIRKASEDVKTLQQQKRNEGCYIATMAYGDYDHPQVIKLREYRDNTLKMSHFGRLLIKYYYKYSPTLVKKLKNNKKVNFTIRKILDRFVTRLDER